MCQPQTIGDWCIEAHQKPSVLSLPFVLCIWWSNEEANTSRNKVSTSRLESSHDDDARVFARLDSLPVVWPSSAVSSSPSPSILCAGSRFSFAAPLAFLPMISVSRPHSVLLAVWWRCVYPPRSKSSWLQTTERGDLYNGRGASIVPFAETP